MVGQNTNAQKLDVVIEPNTNNTADHTNNKQVKAHHKEKSKKKLMSYYLLFILSFVSITFIHLYISTILALIIAIIFAIGFYVYHSEFGQRQKEKLKIMMQIRPYLRASKSLNHSTTLISKFIIGLPLKKNETEVDTFNDIKDYFGERWPFMIKVQNTRKEKLLVQGENCKCISSYNYLDLGKNEELNKAAIEAANAYYSGSHGPRNTCGNMQILVDLEAKIAKFFQKEDALVFSSGYLACMATINGVARQGDLLLMDKLSHASLRAGARVSSGKTVFFKHNDFKDAEKKIKANKFKRLIMVIEGIYSMDGDIGDLPTARKLCDKYNGILIMDEAHSLGTIGKTGHGAEEYFNYSDRADIICGSFTKAISSVGGYFTCSTKMKNYLSFYAPELIYSTPLSAYHAGSAIKAFEIIESNHELTKRLQENGEYLRKRLRDSGYNIGESITCVIPIIFKDIVQVMEMHHYMKTQGYFSAAVMAPACPLDACRFRICVTSSDTKESLDNIIMIFNKAQEKFPESEKIKMLTSMLG